MVSAFKIRVRVALHTAESIRGASGQARCFHVCTDIEMPMMASVPVVKTIILSILVRKSVFGSASPTTYLVMWKPPVIRLGAKKEEERAARVRGRESVCMRAGVWHMHDVDARRPVSARCFENWRQCTRACMTASFSRLTLVGRTAWQTPPGSRWPTLPCGLRCPSRQTRRCRKKGR